KTSGTSRARGKGDMREGGHNFGCFNMSKGDETRVAQSSRMFAMNHDFRNLKLDLFFQFVSILLDLRIEICHNHCLPTTNNRRNIQCPSTKAIFLLPTRYQRRYLYGFTFAAYI